MSSSQVNLGFDPNNPTHVAISAVFNLCINGVLCYFFYQYAFKNPDLAEHGNCWAADDEDGGSLVKLGKFDNNVSEQFLKWFKFGFIICLIGLILAVVQIVQAVTRSPAIKIAVGLISCPFGCGGLAWLIAGMVLRWRHIGKVCAGDYNTSQLEADTLYMTKSGNFIQIYLILTMCLIGTCCCAGCCFAIISQSRS